MLCFKQKKKNNSTSFCFILGYLNVVTKVTVTNCTPSIQVFFHICFFDKNQYMAAFISSSITINTNSIKKKSTFMLTIYRLKIIKSVQHLDVLFIAHKYHIFKVNSPRTFYLISLNEKKKLLFSRSRAYLYLYKHSFRTHILFDIDFFYNIFTLFRRIVLNRTVLFIFQELFPIVFIFCLFRYVSGWMRKKLAFTFGVNVKSEKKKKNVPSTLSKSKLSLNLLLLFFCLDVLDLTSFWLESLINPNIHIKKKKKRYKFFTCQRENKNFSYFSIHECILCKKGNKHTYCSIIKLFPSIQQNIARATDVPVAGWNVVWWYVVEFTMNSVPLTL